MRNLKQWWRDDATLFLSQRLVKTLHRVLRVQEIFAPPAKKLKLRRLRERIEEIEQEKNEMLRMIEADPYNPRRVLEQVEHLEKEHGTPEHADRTRELIDRMTALENENATLQRLRSESEGDDAKRVALMRQYCAEHPDSEMGLAALIGALRKAERYEEAIAVAWAKLGRGERDESPDRERSRTFSTQHCIATLLLEKGDVQEAILHLETLLAEHNKFKAATYTSIAHLTLGDAYSKHGRIADAKKSWQEALRRDRNGVMKMEVAKRLEEVT